MSISDGIVRAATLFIGLGEEKKNNSGFWVNYFRAAWKVYGGGEWCAHFAATCIEVSYLGNNKKPPRVRARSARKLFRKVCKAGRKLRDGEMPMPGDIELRNRPGPGMHAAVVVKVNHDGSRTNIEGNVGRFPAKVKEVDRMDFRYDDAHVGFARLKG